MTVEERLEALEKEVQRLKDVQAIKELKSKYFRALDTKNWDELETTMTPHLHRLLQRQARFPRPEGDHQLLQGVHAPHRDHPASGSQPGHLV